MAGAGKKAADANAEGEKYGRRDDFGAPVDAYLAALPPDQLAIAEVLRALVREVVPDIREEIKWGMPVYTTDKMLCYFTAKAGYVRFGFYARIPFDDPEGKLSGTMPHVKLRSFAEVDRERLTLWIRAAAAA
ncbi:MAG: DUF1801 domain-containing protein [Myxococcota bacterium]